MHRKALEQRLAELALNISEKSAHEAAEALLNLYKEFKYEALENELSAQFHAAENELKAKLQARLGELQSQVQAPNVEASQMPEPAPAPLAETAAPEAEAVEEIPAPAPAAPVQMEIPAAEPEREAEIPAPEAVEEAPEEESASVKEEISAPAAPKATGAPKSLNDRLAGKKLTFGLNDRIGFVKELFDGSTEDFNRVVSQLNTMSTVDEATSFLTEFVAPDYNWDAHEEAANRFLLLVEQRFG